MDMTQNVVLLFLYNNIKINHECEGGKEKSVSMITVWHHTACRLRTNGDHEGRIFLSHPDTNTTMDSICCSLLNFVFYFFKSPQKFLIYTEMRHNLMTSLKITMTLIDPCQGQISFMLLFANERFFILPMHWYRYVR